jgi:hypothetical protein
MKSEDLDRLASLIAAELERLLARMPKTGQRSAWLPPPVRPEPPSRGGEPAPWTGAAQTLGDIAPVRAPAPSDYRDDPEQPAAAFAAASYAPAGSEDEGPSGGGRARARDAARRWKGRDNRRIQPPPPPLGGRRTNAVRSRRPAAQRAGPGGLPVRSRPVGPTGGIEDPRLGRLVTTQLERRGRCCRVRHTYRSPALASSKSAGGVPSRARTTRGLKRPVIVAARHLHLAPMTPPGWGLADGDTSASGAVMGRASDLARRAGAIRCCPRDEPSRRRGSRGRRDRCARRSWR